MTPRCGMCEVPVQRPEKIAGDPRPYCAKCADRKRSGRLLLSASQIEWFSLCERKWGWKYIDKLKAPTNKWAALGVECHAVLEAWLVDGKQPDVNTAAGLIVTPGLKYLPPPRVAKVEGKFVWDLPEEPFDLVGVVDWRDEIGGVPRFGDHKTTGDFQWALTPEELAGENFQSVIYAAYMSHKTGAEKLLGRWVYYLTRGKPAARCVDFEVRREQTEAAFQKIREIGRAMAERKAYKSKAKDLIYNPESCDAYGGCPFRENCNLDPRERLASMMAKETIKQKMQREKAARDSAGAHGAGGNGAAINPPEAALGLPPDPVLAPVGQMQMGFEERSMAAPTTLRERLERKRAAAAVPAEGVSLSTGAPPAPQEPDPVVHPPTPPGTAQDKPRRPRGRPPGAGAKSVTGVSAPIPQPEADPAPPSEPPAPGTSQGSIEIGPSVSIQPSIGSRIRFDELHVDCAMVKPGRFQVLMLGDLMEWNGFREKGIEILDTVPLRAGTVISMSIRTPEGAKYYEFLAVRAGRVIRGL